jgi:hypothetical protein
MSGVDVHDGRGLADDVFVRGQGPHGVVVVQYRRRGDVDRVDVAAVYI